jgi:hypothetical protein
MNLLACKLSNTYQLKKQLSSLGRLKSGPGTWQMKVMMTSSCSVWVVPQHWQQTGFDVVRIEHTLRGPMAPDLAVFQSGSIN